MLVFPRGPSVKPLHLKRPSCFQGLFVKSSQGAQCFAGLVAWMEASHKNHHNWGFPWKRLNFRWWKYVLPHFFFPFLFDWILKSLVDFFHLKIWSSVSNGWVSPNFRDTKLGPKTENIWLPSEWSPSRFHSKISWMILKETYTLEIGKPKVKSYHSQWKKNSGQLKIVSF